jgi:quinol monooxygenase YgiN
MTNGHYTVMIAGLAKSGMEEYVKRTLTQIMQHSRRDKGCIVYNIHQSTENPAEFMVYMQWESREAFEQHNQTPEMKNFRLKLANEIFTEQSPKTYWHMLESN